MKKGLMIYFAGFAVYVIFISLYLLVLAPSEIPEAYRGTPADPAIFMNEQELKESTFYSRLRSLLYFISIPLEWGLYLLLMGLGLSRFFRNQAERIGSWTLVQTAAYVILLTAVTYLWLLPLRIASYRLAVYYGISTQTWSSWLRDLFVGAGISVLTTTIIVWVMISLIKVRPARWWLYAWLASIPLSFLMYYAQPLIIDPLYHDFELLQDEQLEGQIIAMARAEDVPADRVYVINKSEKTNAINAYVNGIGSSLRIVLYDTALARLEQDETLYIMAHEIGHYVMHHLSWALFGEIAGSLLGLYLLFITYNKVVERWGKRWKVRNSYDLALIPAILLIISILTFISSPISNGISRQAEQAADRFAFEKTGDADAAIRTLQKLSLAGRSEVHPPSLVKWFRYGHPTLFERIQYMQSWQLEHEDLIEKKGNIYD